MTKIMTTAQAKTAVQAIRTSYDDLADKITKLWEGRAWEALNYKSWEAMCPAEFGDRKLPEPVRKATVRQLRSQGMSTRAIAAATGASEGTVGRDLASAPNGAVESSNGISHITGVNGKTYKATSPRPPKPEPKPEPAITIRDLRNELVRIAERAAIAADYVEELGYEAVNSDNDVIQRMLTASHLVRVLVAPFVSADDIEQTAAKWKELSK